MAKQEGYWVQETRGGTDHDRTRNKSSFVNWRWGGEWDKVELIENRCEATNVLHLFLWWEQKQLLNEREG